MTASLVRRLRDGPVDNPFDRKTTRDKVHVVAGGGKPKRAEDGVTKGMRRGADQARRWQRYTTATGSKAGGIQDRRWGEYAQISNEDKMLQRFTHERQQRHRQEELRPRTKKEIMEEVVAKAKMHKYNRQNQQEEDELNRQALDKDLPELLSLLPRRRERDINEEKTGVEEGGEKDPEYDTWVREMAFDRRAAPTDRKKTEEELREELAERTKLQEKERLERMQPEESDEQESVEDIMVGPDTLDDGLAYEMDTPSVASESESEEEEEEEEASPDLVDTILQSATGELDAKIHQLARVCDRRAASVAEKFLHYLGDAQKHKTLRRADLILLTIVPIIFPASDHRHPVVTPSLLILCKHLTSTSVATLLQNTYLATLALTYIRLSKRYIPEIPAFLLLALPMAAEMPATGSKLSFEDVFNNGSANPLPVLLPLVEEYARLWIGTSAYVEIFEPIQRLLKSLAEGSGEVEQVIKQLDMTIDLARKSRRPLELQHHRPLAIPSHQPKFDEKYSLESHGDPLLERAQSSKLRAEHKKERKAAMLELRRDAAFTARVKQQQKKTKDAAYHERMAKLVSQIQSTEGHEKNEYERVKRLRTK